MKLKKKIIVLIMITVILLPIKIGCSQKETQNANLSFGCPDNCW